MRVLREKFATLAPEGSPLPTAALRAVCAMRAPMAKLNQAFGAAGKTATF